MAINQRLKQLREKNNLSKLEFSANIGIDNSHYGKIEDGKMGIKLEHLMAISSKFNVTLDWLATGKEAPAQLLNDVKVEVVSSKRGDQLPRVVTVDSQQKDNIVLVPVRAAAGYLSGYGDPEFISSLPSYRIPNMQNGTFRMFQVGGHSMYPTLHDGAFVIGEWVENWQRDIKDDRVYVVVSQNEGVVVKRVLNRLKKYNNLFCKSDNRKDYPSFPISLPDILEVWEVKSSLLFQLPNPADIYDKMNDLEAEILQIKHSLKK
jgi:phage repressor protein C with HTH and peptisase S24 domain